MSDIHYYLGRARQRELLREAEHDREVFQATRMIRRGNNNAVAWVRRLTGNHNGSRLVTGEKN